MTHQIQIQFEDLELELQRWNRTTHTRVVFYYSFVESPVFELPGLMYFDMFLLFSALEASFLHLCLITAAFSSFADTNLALDAGRAWVADLQGRVEAWTGQGDLPPEATAATTFAEPTGTFTRHCA